MVSWVYSEIGSHLAKVKRSSIRIRGAYLNEKCRYDVINFDPIQGWLRLLTHTVGIINS